MKTELELEITRFHKDYCEGAGDGDVTVPASTWERWIKLAASETDAPLFHDDEDAAEGPAS